MNKYIAIDKEGKIRSLKEEIATLKEAINNENFLVSHDLRNIIYNIKILSSFLKERVLKLETANLAQEEEILSFIHLISEASDQAEDIISHFRKGN